MLWRIVELACGVAWGPCPFLHKLCYPAADPYWNHLCICWSIWHPCIFGGDGRQGYRAETTKNTNHKWNSDLLGAWRHRMWRLLRNCPLTFQREFHFKGSLNNGGVREKLNFVCALDAMVRKLISLICFDIFQSNWVISSKVSKIPFQFFWWEKIIGTFLYQFRN